MFRRTFFCHISLNLVFRGGGGHCQLLKFGTCSWGSFSSSFEHSKSTRTRQLTVALVKPSRSCKIDRHSKITLATEPNVSEKMDKYHKITASCGGNGFGKTHPLRSEEGFSALGNEHVFRTRDLAKKFRIPFVMRATVARGLQLSWKNAGNASLARRRVVSAKRSRSSAGMLFTLSRSRTDCSLSFFVSRIPAKLQSLVVVHTTT